MKKSSLSPRNPPPLVPIRKYELECINLPGWTSEYSTDLLTKNEAFKVPTAEVSSLESPSHYRMTSTWIPSIEDSPTEVSEYYDKSVYPRGSEQSNHGVGDQLLREQLRGKRMFGHHQEDQDIADHWMVKQALEGHWMTAQRIADQRLAKQVMEEQIAAKEKYLRNRRLQEYFEKTSSEDLGIDYSLQNHGILREHLLSNRPKTHSPQSYLETKETYHSVPSLREVYPKLESESFTSFYNDSNYPNDLMHYDHRTLGMNTSYASAYENMLSVPSDFRTDVKKSSINVQY